MATQVGQFTPHLTVKRFMVNGKKAKSWRLWCFISWKKTHPEMKSNCPTFPYKCNCNKFITNIWPPPLFPSRTKTSLLEEQLHYFLIELLHFEGAIAIIWAKFNKNDLSLRGKCRGKNLQSSLLYSFMFNSNSKWFAFTLRFNGSH